ncbi:hypothetical protein ACQEU5_20290 [Marinactinospora thermotolerans]|uniref:hypothetical protein n=1 Tax=Marinactinospora thermotolerans TaxID=531310 RepID=UPI003D8E918A
MSPKKKTRRPRGATPTRKQSGRAAPTPTRTVRRDPVVVDIPARWPLLVWSALTLIWAGGSALFFVFYLAEAFAMLGAGEVGAGARRNAAWYLVLLVVCALIVPLCGVAVALRLRRRVAAAMFAVAALLSGAALLWLAPPAELLSAMSTAFTGAS